MRTDIARRLTISFTLVSLSFSFSAARAENQARNPAKQTRSQPLIERTPSPQFSMGSPPANEPGPHYFHASTVQQGVLDGLASLLRAEGIATYNSALAAEHYEAARQASIRNDMLAIDTRYQARLMVRDYRKQLHPPMSPEAVARVSSSRLPQRLSPGDLDPWGRIRWPRELTGQTFAHDRHEVQNLFVTAAGYGAEKIRYEEVKPALDRMLGRLRESQTKLSAERYLAARRFIHGLGYEARISSSEVRLAQRQ